MPAAIPFSIIARAAHVSGPSLILLTNRGSPQWTIFATCIALGGARDLQPFSHHLLSLLPDDVVELLYGKLINQKNT
jgi:hypothetical protein